MGRASDGMKCIEIRSLLKKGAYEDAMEVAETIDISKIKSIVDLKLIASVYERMGEYAVAKDILLQSYERKQSKMTIYRLAYLSIKTQEFDDAEEFYNQFSELAPNSPDRYILRYGIDRAKNVDYVLRIATLQKLKQIEYTEEWGYELAKIYHKAGLYDECIRECRDLIIWFHDGIIVDKAKLLCKYHEEGKQALDAYRVLDKDLSPEEIQQNREQFIYDTRDLSDERAAVKERQLQQMINRDMERTVDLRQVLREEGASMDLLEQEVHRVWGKQKEQPMFQESQQENEQQDTQPIQRTPIRQAETEALLAASVAEVMENPEETNATAYENQYDTSGDTIPYHPEHGFMENEEETSATAYNNEENWYATAPEMREISPEPSYIETLDGNEYGEEAFSEDNMAFTAEMEEVAEQPVSLEQEQNLDEIEVGMEYDSVMETTTPEQEMELCPSEDTQPVEDEQMEESVEEKNSDTQQEKSTRHSRRNARRAAKREKRRKAAQEKKKLEEVANEEAENVTNQEFEMAAVEMEKTANKESESNMAETKNAVENESETNTVEEIEETVSEEVETDVAEMENETNEEVETAAVEIEEVANEESEMAAVEMEEVANEESETTAVEMEKPAEEQPKAETPNKEIAILNRILGRFGGQKKKAAKVEKKQPTVTKETQEVSPEEELEETLPKDAEGVSEKSKETSDTELENVKEISEPQEPMQEEMLEEELQNSEGDIEEDSVVDLDEEVEKSEEVVEEAEEEPEEEALSFTDEYGMLLWEFFQDYQADTRLCEDVYGALEKAKDKGVAGNYIITCKHKERALELARNLTKALESLELLPSHKVAKINAEKLNRMHLEQNYDKIKGGCMFVEDAKKMTADTAQSIMNAINELQGDVVVILSDARPYLMDLLDEYQMMKRYFPYDLSMK
ncbi:putative uncharacterized protein [Clostridium sp. CAG:411]|nr:hypothetical protein [Lachnospiraceae bacterium]CDE42191.1 putative uncharacterized protein [Clostridium sp. CAG:411]